MPRPPPRPGAIGMPRPRPPPPRPRMLPGGDIGPAMDGRWPGMPRGGGTFGLAIRFALIVLDPMALKFGRRGMELLLFPPPELVRVNGSSRCSPLKLELDALRARSNIFPLDARPAIF